MFKSNFHITVVEVGLLQTSYTTSEAMGSVSVCVNISSAQLARNVSVTLGSMTAGTAVGKSYKTQHKNPYIYQLYRTTVYLQVDQPMTKILNLFSCMFASTTTPISCSYFSLRLLLPSFTDTLHLAITLDHQLFPMINAAGLLVVL